MKKLIMLLVMIVPLILNAQHTNSHPVMNSDASDLRIEMHRLWEDHLVYTRNYIISALADLEDLNAVAERLLKNQDDIGDAVKTYYGEEAGNKLSALLRDHILIAAEVINAAKANNNEDLKKAQERWNSNGNDIAVFLSGANPNWSITELKEMLSKHLELTAGSHV